MWRVFLLGGIRPEVENGANASVVGPRRISLTEREPRERTWNLGGLAARGLAAGRVGRDLKVGVEREFFEDIVHVALDGVRGNMKSTRDFLVAEASRNRD